MGLLEDILGLDGGARFRQEHFAGMAHDPDAARSQAVAAAAWQPHRPRKYVESRVIEPKQITGETT